MTKVRRSEVTKVGTKTEERADGECASGGQKRKNESANIMGMAVMAKLEKGMRRWRLKVEVERAG